MQGESYRVETGPRAGETACGLFYPRFELHRQCAAVFNQFPCSSSIRSSRNAAPMPLLRSCSKVALATLRRSITERAAVVLALEHHLNTPGVFSAARRIVLADFAAVGIDAHGSVQDQFVAQNIRWLRARKPAIERARDGTPADHGQNGRSRSCICPCS